MLKGLNPILGPDMLAVLRAMGHGDEIAIVDGNYPAETQAARLIRCDGLALPPVLDAVLSVLPVDDFVDQAIFRSVNMTAIDTPDPVHQEMEAICARHCPGLAVVPLVGQAFYDRVKAAHAIIHTSEPRLYANIVLRKGVIYP